jgi:hypothetical protein
MTIEHIENIKNHAILFLDFTGSYANLTPVIIFLTLIFMALKLGIFICLELTDNPSVLGSSFSRLILS